MRGKLKTWWEALVVFMNKKHTFFVPRRLPEVLAAIFLLSSSVLTYYYSIFIKLPEILEGYTKTILFLGILGTWIFIAILSNYYLLRKRRSSIRNRMLLQPVVQPLMKPSTSGAVVSQENSEVYVREATKHMSEHFTRTPFGDNQNWHICAVCEVFVPPRSWHCNICNVCILRRDHHCVFTGCCIGEENQSNFMGLILYLAIGSTICSAFSIYYFLWLKEYGFWYFIFRSLVLIYTFIYDFDIIQILSSIVLMGQCVAWGVFIYYMNISLKGQTSADAHKKIARVTPGTKQKSYDNLRNFLGPRPILRIFWPFHKALQIDYNISASEYKSTVDDYQMRVKMFHY